MLRAQEYAREVEVAPGGNLSFSTDNGAQVIPRILDAIEAAGGKVNEIGLHRQSLEDVFIHFTGRTLRDEGPKKVSLFVGAGMPQHR